MPDLTRLISGLMRLGNVLLSISNRCWSNQFVIDGSDSVQSIGASVMPAAEAQFCFTSNRIEIHPCSNCGAPTTLVSSNSSRSNFEIRTFQCFNCDRDRNSFPLLDGSV